MMQFTVGQTAKQFYCAYHTPRNYKRQASVKIT